MTSNSFYTNLYNTYNNTSYLNTLARLLSDFLFVCPNYNIAETYSRRENNVYVYEFAYRFYTSQIPNDLVTYLGPATHADEIVMTFGFVLSEALDLFTNDAEKRFDMELVKYWTNFVKFDNPNGLTNITGVTWDPFLNPNSNSYQQNSLVNTGKYISFTNAAIQMKTGYSEHNCDFWKMTTTYQGNNQNNSANSLGAKSIYLSVLTFMMMSFLF